MAAPDGFSNKEKEKHAPKVFLVCFCFVFASTVVNTGVVSATANKEEKQTCHQYKIELSLLNTGFSTLFQKLAELSFSLPLLINIHGKNNKKELEYLC